MWKDEETDVRKSELLEETEELIKIFVTSIKTVEKKPRLGVVECPVLHVYFSFDVRCSTFIFLILIRSGYGEIQEERKGFYPD
jgi:hypothetical protein